MSNDFLKASKKIIDDFMEDIVESEYLVGALDYDPNYIINMSTENLVYVLNLEYLDDKIRLKIKHELKKRNSPLYKTLNE